jgi:hypothetical protein
MAASHWLTGRPRGLLDVSNRTRAPTFMPGDKHDASRYDQLAAPRNQIWGFDDTNNRDTFVDSAHIMLCQWAGFKGLAIGPDRPGLVQWLAWHHY